MHRTLAVIAFAATAGLVTGRSTCAGRHLEAHQVDSNGGAPPILAAASPSSQDGGLRMFPWDKCEEHADRLATSCRTVVSYPERGWRSVACPCTQQYQPDIWGRACYERELETENGGIRLWLPPAVMPEMRESWFRPGATAEMRQAVIHNCAWWVGSREPRPDGLAFALARSWYYYYGLNVYRDGRVVFKSLRCPSDRSVHVSSIPATTVSALIERFRKASFSKLEACYELGDDVEREVLAFYDDAAQTVISMSEASMGAPSALADLLDTSVGTGRWLQ